MHDRREQLKEARKLGRDQRRAKNSLVKTQNSKWVNPRTLHVLSEMGFDKDLCALALQKTDNDINQSVNDHEIYMQIMSKFEVYFLLRLRCCKKINRYCAMNCCKV